MTRHVDVSLEEAARILHYEYPTLCRQEVERMAKHNRHDKWFQALLAKRPRSVGLSQAKDDLDVEEIGERELAAEPDGDEEEADNREAEIKALEASAKLLLGSNPSRVQRMTASVMLGLLSGDYDAKAIEKHFQRSDETVRRITKRVKEYRAEWRVSAFAGNT
jgi:hypothetical protein